MRRLGPAFGRVGWAEATGALDVQIMAFVVPLLAIRALGASPFQVGLLTACEYLGFLAFGLQAGSVVDRWCAVTVWWSSASARAVLLAGIAVLLAFDRLAMGPLYVFMVALSVSLVLTSVSSPKALTEVVPTTLLTAANSRIGALTSTAEVIGPLLAGAIISHAGFENAILLALFCSISCLVAILRVPRTPARSTGPRVSMLRQVTQGVRYSLAVPFIRMILLRSSIYNFSNIATSVLFLVLLAQLDFSGTEIGVVFAVAGGAAAIAALLVERMADRWGIGRTVIAACTSSGVVSLLLPLASRSPVFIAVVIAYALASAGVMVSNILLSSVRQAVCAPEYLGRTAATTRFVIWGVIPFGSLLAGVLGSAIGPRAAIAIAVCGELLSIIPLWRSQLRTLESMDQAVALRAEPLGA